MISNVLTPEIRNIIQTEDWSDENYSVQKAFVGSWLSALAYENISELELEEKKRIKIIPCQIFREIVRKGTSNNFIGGVQNFELGNVFIIHRNYAAIVGIISPKVVFIAIRGTQKLYDWGINLNARKCKGVTGLNEEYHLGFYRAISSCLEPISAELRKMNVQDDCPIFVTGHSLGGAMAAIFHKIWSTSPYEIVNPIGSFWRYQLRNSSCYTYGMPRYGNMAAVQDKIPFHMYNEKDIVPTVPPRWMGFENCLNEYRLDGRSIENISNRANINFIEWIIRLILGAGIKNHDIELYKNRIEQLTK